MPDFDRVECAGKKDLFEQAGAGAAHSVQEAKQVCEGCPIREGCLSWALNMEGDFSAAHRWGIYGGLTVPERVAFQESQRAA